MKNFGNSLKSYKYKYNNKEQNIDDYVSYMLIRTTTMFKYSNLPDTIPEEILEGMLQSNGSCIFTKVDDEFYIFTGTPTGAPDVYNNSKSYRVTNIALNLNKEFTKDVDMVLIENDNLQMGLLPMLYRYCTQLVESDITMIIATINKRIQTLLVAGDTNTEQSAKLFLKKIEDGELGIIAENKMFESLKVSNASTTSHMKDLYEYHQYVKASLYNELGLNANFNMKRELLSTAEVEMNSDGLYPLVDNMLMCRRHALDKINEMYGLDIKVEFNSSWDYRVQNGEPIDTEVEEPETETETNFIDMNKNEGDSIIKEEEIL